MCVIGHIVCHLDLKALQLLGSFKLEATGVCGYKVKEKIYTGLLPVNTYSRHHHYSFNHFACVT